LTTTATSPAELDLTPNGDVVILATGTATPTPPLNSTRERILARYDAGGESVWRVQEAIGPSDSVAAMAVDVRGESWVIETSVQDADGDAAISKYDEQGRRLWTTASGVSGDNRATDVAATSNGVAVLGYTTGETSFLIRFGG
jgi:hypothetical protein